MTLPLDHSRDDDFDTDRYGPDGVAEDPSVFKEAVQHRVTELRSTGPGSEAFIHDLELHEGHRADGSMEGEE